MAKPLLPKNTLLLKALMAEDGGSFVENTAKQIVWGYSRMDSNQKAIMIENNYGISAYTWIKLFKKSKEDIFEGRAKEVYALKQRREKSTLQNDFLFEALMAEQGGCYGEDAAKNIVYGVKLMDSNERAIRMELSFDIAPVLWLGLFKGEAKSS